MSFDVKLIELDRELSVQKLPKVDTPTGNVNRMMFTSTRGALLPAHGTRERENSLLSFWRDDFNSMYRGAIAGLSKRVQSTPWSIQGDSEHSTYYQQLFMNADFARGWDTFINKLVVDYSRYDGGAYIELIGAGDSSEQLVGALAGISILDSLRCLPTGDPEFPVVYMDSFGELHVMHHTRVIRFVDGLDSEEMVYGYGDCSLSRCITPVARDILINRYVQQTLDDNPPPGIMIFNNITDNQLRESITKMEQERSTDFGGKWGKTVRLYGLFGSEQPSVTSVPFTTPPEKFDLEKYKQLNAREQALAIGLDIQDIWELTGAGLGTATQSEVLHVKSKGKALGRILKTLERVLNLTLPRSLEFTFEYQDADEDLERANIAATWSNVVLSLQGKLTPDEERQLLANQVEGIRDVITDQDGNIIRVNDADPKTPEQVQPLEEPTSIEPVQEDEQAVIGDKALADTQSAFKQEFTRLAQLVVSGKLSKAAMKPALRLELAQRGIDAYKDGLEDGGREDLTLDDEGKKDISVWRSQQSPFITKFVNELFNEDKVFQPQEIANRADMWVNKSLNRIYFEGLRAANKEQRFMWVIDPQKEHCVTCLKLNGQIHRMKVYISKNLLPQSSALVCGGYKCGCKLVPTNDKARGNLRAVRFVRDTKSKCNHMEAA
jgi:hypothetical protein